MTQAYAYAQLWKSLHDRWLSSGREVLVKKGSWRQETNSRSNCTSIKTYSRKNYLDH